MIAAALIGAGLLWGASQTSPQAAPQTLPQSASSAAPPLGSEEPTELGDVFVNNRPVEAVAQAFVEAVAAPAHSRGLARWYGTICVGVVNVRQDVAQPLIDHISNVALDLGLRTGTPGCRPNIVIVFADEGAGMATALVDRDRRIFHLGVGGLDRGKVALEAFQTADRPVRWWHVSMPTVGANGGRAIRMPGDVSRIYVPGEGIVNRGRPITDSLSKVIVIVDIDDVQAVNLAQLGDYLAMVTLAQVDLEGSTGDFDSVLNLFERPAQTAGLTEWDQTYLDVLYDALPERVNPSRQSSDLARRVMQTRRAERAAQSSTE